MCMNDCGPKVKNENGNIDSLPIALIVNDALSSFERLKRLTLKKDTILLSFTKTFYQDDTVTIREHLFDRVSMNKFKNLKNEISYILKKYKNETLKLSDIKEKYLSVDFADKEFKTKEIEKVLLKHKKTEEYLEKISMFLKQIIGSDSPGKEYLKAHDWLKENKTANSDEFFVEKFGDIIGANYRLYINSMKNIAEDRANKDLTYNSKKAKYAILLNNFQLTVEKNFAEALENVVTIRNYAKEKNVSKNIDDEKFKNLFSVYINSFKTHIAKNIKYVKKIFNKLLICESNDLYSTKKDYLIELGRHPNIEKCYNMFAKELIENKYDETSFKVFSFEIFIDKVFDILMKFECAGVGLTCFCDYANKEKRDIIYYEIFESCQTIIEIDNNTFNESEENCSISKEDTKDILTTFKILKIKSNF